MDKPLKRWGTGLGRDDPVCFLGREHEVRRIEEALGKKQSMLVSGPADIGKTALIEHVLRVPPQNPAGRCLYLSNFKDLRDLLSKLLISLYQARNPVLRRQLHSEGVSAANFNAWLKTKPTPRLKGTLYRSIEHGNFRVILDHVPPFTRPVAKVVKELFWMRDTPVYLLVRDAPAYKIDQFSRFFYWGRRQRLLLSPLSKPTAVEVLEWHIRRFGLGHLDLNEFRDEVLELSGCVPGAIVKMCAMASDKRYQSGSRVKTKLVHIDYLTRGKVRFRQSLIPQKRYENDNGHI